MPETLIIAGVIAAVAGTGYSIYSAEQSRSASKDANKVAMKQQKLDEQRKQRQAIRQERILRGQAANLAAQTGAGQDSSIAGGLSGLSSSLNSSLGYTAQQGALGVRYNGFAQDASDAKFNAELGGNIASLGASAFSFAAGGGVDKVKAQFGS